MRLYIACLLFTCGIFSKTFSLPTLIHLPPAHSENEIPGYREPDTAPKFPVIKEHIKELPLPIDLSQALTNVLGRLPNTEDIKDHSVFGLNTAVHGVVNHEFRPHKKHEDSESRPQSDHVAEPRAFGKPGLGPHREHGAEHYAHGKPEFRQHEEHWGLEIRPHDDPHFEPHGSDHEQANTEIGHIDEAFEPKHNGPRRVHKYHEVGLDWAKGKKEGKKRLKKANEIEKKAKEIGEKYLKDVILDHQQLMDVMFNEMELFSKDNLEHMFALNKEIMKIDEVKKISHKLKKIIFSKINEVIPSVLSCQDIDEDNEKDPDDTNHTLEDLVTILSLRQNLIKVQKQLDLMSNPEIVNEEQELEYDDLLFSDDLLTYDMDCMDTNKDNFGHRRGRRHGKPGRRPSPTTINIHNYYRDMIQPNAHPPIPYHPDSSDLSSYTYHPMIVPETLKPFLINILNNSKHKFPDVTHEAVSGSKPHLVGLKERGAHNNYPNNKHYWAKHSLVGNGVHGHLTGYTSLPSHQIDNPDGYNNDERNGNVDNNDEQNYYDNDVEGNSYFINNGEHYGYGYKNDELYGYGYNNDEQNSYGYNNGEQNSYVNNNGERNGYVYNNDEQTFYGYNNGSYGYGNNYNGDSNTYNSGNNPEYAKSNGYGYNGRDDSDTYNSGNYNGHGGYNAYNSGKGHGYNYNGHDGYNNKGYPQTNGYVYNNNGYQNVHGTYGLDHNSYGYGKNGYKNANDILNNQQYDSYDRSYPQWSQANNYGSKSNSYGLTGYGSNGYYNNYGYGLNNADDVEHNDDTNVHANNKNDDTDSEKIDHTESSMYDTGSENTDDIDEGDKIHSIKDYFKI
ncbi:hypothetical protein LOTGIDRAFT_174202 [Lottia gigantea]|uniref:Uncharacterized protein n=1 Tax=Lottia gigantea TaxID=225164 RepID=V4C9S5_LOTGI|nr:hypothetical protein LOTGIDRAFT_174202 [Lottia gigantea]ESO98514.1 hypothetical protein LOTGIDRAFT_174202 [Lottia gigantea]